MEAGENPARSRHCKEGTAVRITPLRNRFVGRQTAVKISESGNMHEAASFTVPEKHRVKFFIGEMQIIRPDKRKRYSENGLQPEGEIPHRLQLFVCLFRYTTRSFHPSGAASLPDPTDPLPRLLKVVFYCFRSKIENKYNQYFMFFP